MKLRLALGAAITAALTVLVAPSALAYDQPSLSDLSGTAADGRVAPGETFTLAGGFSEVRCDWTSSFEGEAWASGSGTTFSVRFTAPDEVGTYDVTLRCRYDDAAGTTNGASVTPGGALVVRPAAMRTRVFTLPIVVGDPTRADASTADVSGALPDTGGPDGRLLAVGGGLVVAGAGVALRVRRRSAAA